MAMSPKVPAKPAPKPAPRLAVRKPAQPVRIVRNPPRPRWK